MPAAAAGAAPAVSRKSQSHGSQGSASRNGNAGAARPQRQETREKRPWYLRLCNYVNYCLFAACIIHLAVLIMSYRGTKTVYDQDNRERVHGDLVYTGAHVSVPGSGMISQLTDCHQLAQQLLYTKHSASTAASVGMLCSVMEKEESSSIYGSANFFKLNINTGDEEIYQGQPRVPNKHCAQKGTFEYEASGKVFVDSAYSILQLNETEKEKVVKWIEAYKTHFGANFLARTTQAAAMDPVNGLEYFNNDVYQEYLDAHDMPRSMSDHWDHLFSNLTDKSTTSWQSGKGFLPECYDLENLKGPNKDLQICGPPFPFGYRSVVIIFKAMQKLDLHKMPQMRARGSSMTAKAEFVRDLINFMMTRLRNRSKCHNMLNSTRSDRQKENMDAEIERLAKQAQMWNGFPEAIDYKPHQRGHHECESRIITKDTQGNLVIAHGDLNNCFGSGESLSGAKKLQHKSFNYNWLGAFTDATFCSFDERRTKSGTVTPSRFIPISLKLRPTKNNTTPVKFWFSVSGPHSINAAVDLLYWYLIGMLDLPEWYRLYRVKDVRSTIITFTPPSLFSVFGAHENSYTLAAVPN